jgi:hypothetical protein
MGIAGAAHAVPCPPSRFGADGGTSATVQCGAPAVPAAPGTRWMYFKGNGHLLDRNGEFDRLPTTAQRYFYIPAREGVVDTLPWRNGFSLTWQFIPIRQAAYYTTFFYSASQNTNFSDLRDTHGYVGCHPYPGPSINNEPIGERFTRHRWEISIDGNDEQSTFDGVRVPDPSSVPLVEYGQPHTQAFSCQVLNQDSGRSLITFFMRNRSASDFATPLTYEHAGKYAKAPLHSHKAIVFGNAPWWRDHQYERLSGFIRRIKIFSGTLSRQDLIAESLSDTLVTAAGQRLAWWAKINPATPDDLTSDFVGQDGVRRIGQWIDSARCQIVRSEDFASHVPLQNAARLPQDNLTHLERG